MLEILTHDEFAELQQLLTVDRHPDILANWSRELLRRIDDLDVPMLRHPLGFVCVPIFRSGKAGMCLHVWAAQVRTADLTTSTIHAHSWNLISHVLCGQLVHQKINVQMVERNATHRIFTVRSAGFVDYIERTEDVVTEHVVSAEAVNSGDTYHLPAGQFHSTDVEGMTVTVVLAESICPGPEVTLGDISMIDHTVKRELCDIQEATAVRAVLNLCIGNISPSRMIR